MYHNADSHSIRELTSTGGCTHELEFLRLRQRLVAHHNQVLACLTSIKCWRNTSLPLLPCGLPKLGEKPCGVPWNVLKDDLLRLPLPRKVLRSWRTQGCDNTDNTDGVPHQGQHSDHDLYGFTLVGDWRIRNIRKISYI